MSLVRITAAFPYTGGLDRDISENTWWFNVGEDDIGANITGAVTALTNFYDDDEDQTTSLLNRMPEYIDPEIAYMDVSIIEESTGDQIGNTTRFTPDYGSNPSGLGLPAEVSLCMSFAADLGAIPVRRRRGRIYLGPLKVNTDVDSPLTGYGRPAAQLINDLNTAGRKLLEASVNTDPGTWQWVIYSRASREFHIVSRGWVDDEWDTQRRRGMDATTRATFTTGP